MIQPHEFGHTGGNPTKPSSPSGSSPKPWKLIIPIQAEILLERKEAPSAEDALAFIKSVLRDLPITVHLGNQPLKITFPDDPCVMG